MDASSGQHQEMGTNSLDNMLVCSSKAQQERKPRPQPEQALKCPRCDSTNTKFCYYNNYSLSQPRYFCKSCRRYWTKGGTLRNVPVGGGCRKNKRSSSSSSSASSSKRTQDHQPLLTGLPPPLSYDSTNDLSLAFARLQKQAGGQLGFDRDHDYDHHHHHHHHHHDFPILGNTTNSNTHCDINLGNPSISLDALRRGFLENLDTQNNNFQDMYYPYAGVNLGEAENGGGGGGVSGGEMFLPYGGDMNTSTSSSNATTTAVTVTTMKQELFNNNNRENDQNRILWGFPWQQQQQLNGGDHHGNFVGDLDTGKESWNGLNSSPWHGLLDSPLM